MKNVRHIFQPTLFRMVEIYESEYLISDTVFICELNGIFIISTSNHILCDTEFDQKYENKYNINNIYLYPICFHPYVRRA